MSYSTFSLALKSTIDKKVYDLATTKSVGYFDLDTALTDIAFLESDAPGLGWSLLTLVEFPRDPLWSVEFEVGGKTSKDPAQYLVLDIVSMVLDAFTTGTTVDVLDYSGEDAPTTVMGELFITNVSVMPSQLDRSSGFRMVNIQGKVLRWL